MVSKALTESYEVHSSLREDLNEGWIWIKDDGLKDKIEYRRRIVRIKTKNEKKVYCEALYIDDYYVKERKKRGYGIDFNKDHLIFISGWYRQKLGIEREDIGCQRNLTITLPKLRLPMWSLQACLQHPQIVVFLATVLAIIGLGLGVIAVGLGFIAIKDLCVLGRRASLAFMSVGIVIGFLGILFCLYGIIGFFKRSLQHDTPTDG
jgi:hypothetical protein